MAANTSPIYAVAPQLGLGGAIIGPSANTATDGTGSNIYRIFTAGSNGSYVQRIIFKAVASPAATVARIWYCSDTGAFTPGSTNTAANTTMICELSLAAFSASNTAASPQYEIPVNIGLPASTKILVSFGTSTGAAGNGYNPLVCAGDY